MNTPSDRLIVLSLGPKSRVLSIATDGSDPRVLVDDLDSKPDGVTIDPANKHLYYTFMGVTRTGEGDFWENEGYIERCDYDGGNRQVVVPFGSFVTGKQITFDAASNRLYWCDREGMRVMSCRTVPPEAGSTSPRFRFLTGTLRRTIRVDRISHRASSRKASSADRVSVFAF